MRIKSKHIDRLFVTGSAAALVAWMGCVVMIWARAFDASDGAVLLTISAVMFSMWFAVRLPGKAARLVQRLLTLLKVHETLAVELAAARTPRAGTRQARTLLRLLGAMTIFAVMCGLASTAVAYWIGGLVDWLARWFVLGRWGWLAARFCVQFVAMLPISLGVCVVFLAGTLVRRGSGRDVYATICRDWTWSTALGLTAIGIAWRMGLSLLGLPVLLLGLLIVASVALLQRKRVTLRPPAMTSTGKSGSRRALAWSIRGTFAALAAISVIQMRLLGDVAGVGLDGRLCWAGLSAGLLAGFLGTVDHKSAPPGRPQGLGAAIGLAAGFGLQISLAAMCLIPGPLSIVAGVLAALTQIPLAALSAVLLSRQRRRFAAMGAAARTYVSHVCVGLGLGFLLLLAAGMLPVGRVAVAVIAVAVLAVAPVYGITLARRANRQVQWAFWGAVLLCSVTGAVLAATATLRMRVGEISPGIWLSAAGPVGDAQTPLKYLPLRPAWRSRWIGYIQESIIASRPGSWWVIASAPGDVPAGSLPTVRMSVSYPDPTSLRFQAGAWGTPQARPDELGFLLNAQIATERFEGVLLAPMQADHLQAWRVYNLTTLRRCFRHIHPGGLMMLRTQASGKGMFEAIRVAKTFFLAIKSGWFIGQFKRGRLDILLAGPADNVPPLPRPDDAIVIRLEQLWRGGLDCRAIRILHPPGRVSRSTGPWTLLLDLREIQRREDAQANDDGL